MADTEKDLDETRRLLYMALAAGRTDRHNLVGTLTNALVHHSGLETDAVEVLDRLIRVVGCTDVTRPANPEGAWVLGLIETATAREAESAAEPSVLAAGHAVPEVLLP